jgi:hypothetical protein
MISIFLIIRELFPKTDAVNPRIRKILYSTLIGLLLLLSVINIYNKNEENEKLINTAKSILERTKEINTSQDNTFKTIKRTGEELNQIDSVINSVNDTLIGQVKLIKEAVGKSKALLALERTKLNLGRPRISVLSANVKIISFFQDSTKLQLDVEARNNGQRNANRVIYHYLLITYKNGSNIRNIFLSDYDSKSIGTIGPNVKLNVKVPFDLTKSEFNTRYGRGIVVCRLQYVDEVGEAHFDENYFIGIKTVDGKGLVTHTTTSKEKDYAVKYLKELRLLEYLSKE